MAEKSSRYAQPSDSAMHIHQIDVAKAYIRGKVSVRSPPERPVVPTLKKGDAVELNVDFAFEEVDGARDEYRFRLACSVDGKEEEPVESVWSDTTHFPEKAKGLLQKRLVFKKAGQHTVDVTVEARHDIDNWEDGKAVATDDQRVRVRIPVTVQ